MGPPSILASSRSRSSRPRPPSNLHPNWDRPTEHSTGGEGGEKGSEKKGGKKKKKGGGGGKNSPPLVEHVLFAAHQHSFSFAA